MDDLERRVIVLEQQFRHERERSDWRHQDLSQQLLELQSRSLTLTTGNLVKIVVAVLLPLIVWLITGDLRKALEASRLARGG